MTYIIIPVFFPTHIYIYKYTRELGLFLLSEVVNCLVHVLYNTDYEMQLLRLSSLELNFRVISNHN